MCDKAVDACLPALQFVPDWFVTNKMLEKLVNHVFSNDDIVFVNEDSDSFKFFSDDIGLNTKYLNNIHPEDDNFGDDDPEIIIHDRHKDAIKAYFCYRHTLF